MHLAIIFTLSHLYHFCFLCLADKFSLFMPVNDNIIYTCASINNSNALLGVKWQSQIFSFGSHICSLISMLSYIFHDWKAYCQELHSVCMYVYIYVCTYIHTFLQFCLYPSMHTYIHVWLHPSIQIHVCISTCKHIYMFRLMHVCLHTYKHTIYIHACTYKYIIMHYSMDVSHSVFNLYIWHKVYFLSEQNKFFNWTQAFARSPTLASSGVRKNVHPTNKLECVGKFYSYNFIHYYFIFILFYFDYCDDVLIIIQVHCWN